MQAAVVPLLVSTANVSGIQWDMVDGSALTAQKSAALQVIKNRLTICTSPLYCIRVLLQALDPGLPLARLPAPASPS